MTRPHEQQVTSNERPRSAAVDVFRGATVAAMLLVNNPGTWSAVYWPLTHAEWHGITPTDLIFPFFLFVVGITTYFSKPDPRKIVRRGLLIVLFGLLLNAFPFFWWGKIPDNPDPTLWQRIEWRLEHLRFMGVLQRIGIAYMVAALIALRATRRQQLVVVVVVLVGYCAVLMIGPLEPPAATIAARVDRAILGTNHIWSATKTWDPEGPLSTIPAVATVLMGILAAPWVEGRDVRRLAVAGASGIGVGLVWSVWFPINKNLWTSSYALFTAGCAMLILAALMKVPMGKWSTPFVVYGVNPLVAFVGSGIMARCIDSLFKINGKSLHALSYELLFKPYFPPKLGSLLWALGFVLLWLGILGVMYRRGVILKV